MIFPDAFVQDVKILFSGDSPHDRKVRDYLKRNDPNLGNAIFHCTLFKAEHVRKMIESGRANELLDEATKATKRFALYQRWLSFVQPGTEG